VPEDETLKQEADRGRRGFFTDYCNALNTWQAWRDNYRRHLQQHQAGANPGFSEGWTPNWPKEEFDVRHLARAMCLSEVANICEKYLYEALDYCKGLGLEPFSWQGSRFLEVPEGCPESREEAMAAAAPKEMIYEWLRQVPYGAGADCGSGAGNKNPPVAAAGYHPVEYPDSMAVEPDKDIET